MNRYPRLSEAAYEDLNKGSGERHRSEVVAMIVDYAVDMWKYYSSCPLSDTEQERVRSALDEAFPDSSC